MTAPGRRVVQSPPRQPANEAPSANEDPSAPRLPWAAQAGAAQEPITNRMRREVPDLPGWEPLPPGEIYVQRNRDR